MEMTTVFELRDKYFEKEGEKTKITGYDVDPFPITAKRFKSVIINVKIQLRSETDTAHHT